MMALGSPGDKNNPVYRRKTLNDWETSAIELNLELNKLKTIAGHLANKNLVVLRDELISEPNGRTSLLTELCKDELTGLGNKRYIHSKLKNISKNSDTSFAVFFIDLDGFKPFNDKHGHAVGDKILKIAALRIKGCIRCHDDVSRIHGDEFVVILNCINNEQDVISVATKIVDALKTIKIGRVSFSVGASIGICIVKQCNDPFDALAVADSAMYESKKNGKNCFTIRDI